MTGYRINARFLPKPCRLVNFGVLVTKMAFNFNLNVNFKVKYKVKDAVPNNISNYVRICPKTTPYDIWRPWPTDATFTFPFHLTLRGQIQGQVTGYRINFRYNANRILWSRSGCWSRKWPSFLFHIQVQGKIQGQRTGYLKTSGIYVTACLKMIIYDRWYSWPTDSTLAFPWSLTLGSVSSNDGYQINFRFGPNRVSMSSLRCWLRKWPSFCIWNFHFVSESQCQGQIQGERMEYQTTTRIYVRICPKIVPYDSKIVRICPKIVSEIFILYLKVNVKVKYKVRGWSTKQRPEFMSGFVPK